MSQITGYNAQVGICVFVVNICNARLKSLYRVKPMQSITSINQMNVGYLNYFRACSVFSREAAARSNRV